MSNKKILSILAVLVVPAVLAAAATTVPQTLALATEDPTFTSFDFPHATQTIAYDINSRGDIVGRYTLAGEVNRDHGFLRTRHGEFTSIDVPGANFRVALGINGHGDIVGPYRLATDPMRSRRGFILRKGTFTSFVVPGAVFTQPLGINNRGDIVGRFCFTVVPVNCVGKGSDTHGFLRTNDGTFTTIDVPGALRTTAWKINPRGQIVGAYEGADGKINIFVFSAGHITTIDVPEAVAFENGGITPSGDIAGFYCDSPTCIDPADFAVSHGFLLSSDGDFTPIDFPGAIATFALGINARGDIVGSYNDHHGRSHAFVLEHARETARRWMTTGASRWHVASSGVQGSDHPVQPVMEL